MAEKLTRKQLENIKKFREENPKEANHKRRSRIIKETPWWIPIDRHNRK